MICEFSPIGANGDQGNTCRGMLKGVASIGGPVKNGFSDPTKEQEGRDQPRKDMNRRQGKALREGCCARKMARMGVSSREKMNTNKNLARATTKSKSEMQTVSNGCVSRRGRDRGFRGASQHWRPCRVSRIEAK